MTPAEYTAKWADESRRAMRQSVLAGEPIPAAAERIHRRYHRAVSVAELTRSMLAGQAYVRAFEAKRAERWAALHGAIVGNVGTVGGIDRAPSPYWRNQAFSASAGRDEYGGPSKQEGIGLQSVIGVPRCGGGSGVTAPSPDISHRASGQSLIGTYGGVPVYGHGSMEPAA